MDSLTSSSILLRVIADNNLKSLYGGFGGPYRFFAKIQVHHIQEFNNRQATSLT